MDNDIVHVVSRQNLPNKNSNEFQVAKPTIKISLIIDRDQ